MEHQGALDTLLPGPLWTNKTGWQGGALSLPQRGFPGDCGESWAFCPADFQGPPGFNVHTNEKTARAGTWQQASLACWSPPFFCLLDFGAVEVVLLEGRFPRG